MMSEFVLHPKLAADCFVLGTFQLSQLLLMDDSNFPWFILVPARAGVREIFELEEPDRIALLNESVSLSRALQAAFAADKLNVAALGNVVPQLHIHHIVRYRDDPAWPDPVWGKVQKRAYTPRQREDVVARLRERLGTELAWAH